MGDSPRLSAAARDAIASPDNETHLSIATAWEIAIKGALGKLRIPGDFGSAVESGEFQLLQISLRHVDLVERPPHHHRDPFGRMLVAQAIVDGMTLVSADP